MILCYCVFVCLQLHLCGIDDPVDSEPDFLTFQPGRFRFIVPLTSQQVIQEAEFLVLQPGDDSEPFYAAAEGQQQHENDYRRVKYDHNGKVEYVCLSVTSYAGGLLFPRFAELQSEVQQHTHSGQERINSPLIC